jgi:hypothetical protein
MQTFSILTVLAALPYALSASLVLHLPPTTVLTNPQSLPPQTHATLTTNGTIIRAPFTRASTFLFPSLLPGSYLAEIWTPSYNFVPMRVDVDKVMIQGANGEMVEKIDYNRQGGRLEGGSVEVWQTFRGNEWSNKGQKLGGGEGVVDVQVQVLKERKLFEERPACE